MPNLLEEAKLHFNEPVLIGFELCRVIGYGEDGEECYLLVRHPHRGVIWNTFVGGYIWLTCLKEQNVVTPVKRSFPGELWTDYSRMDSLLELNGCPKEAEFMVKERGE